MTNELNNMLTFIAIFLIFASFLGCLLLIGLYFRRKMEEEQDKKRDEWWTNEILNKILSDDPDLPPVHPKKWDGFKTLEICAN